MAKNPMKRCGSPEELRTLLKPPSIAALDYASDLKTANRQQGYLWMPTKRNLSWGHYVSSSAEEMARACIDDLDASRPDFLYGPRFRPVMKGQIGHSSSQFVVTRTVSTFASIKKVRALQVVE